ncbi:MAG: hypothetical protein RLY93_15410 [Sumerlaeia bacterium]
MPRLALVLCIASLLSGCAAMKTTGRVVATPVTGVRDVVDAPLVSVTNVFAFWAERANPTPQPGAGAGWSWKGGFNFGVGVDFSYYVFWAASGLFGGVDYLVCRSIWPNFPAGISPWKERAEPWGNLYFPNTRALWGKDLDAWKTEDETPPAGA